MKRIYFLLFLLFPLYLFLQPVSAEGLVKDENFPSPNNMLDATNAFDIDGDYVYMGGSFTELGDKVKQFLITTDNVNGTYDLGWPEFNHRISKVISDGEGGWYVVGEFTIVNSNETRFLVHVFPDKSVDPNFIVDLDYEVGDILLDGDSLYISGYFHNVNGVERDYLAKINKETGAVDADWNASLSSSVNSMIIVDDSLYIGGNFTSVGGLTRNYIAKINELNGQVDASWDAFVNNAVYSITSDGTSIYLGGFFTTVQATTRNRVAKVSKTTGVLDATWNPNANNGVYKLVFSDGYLYAGGFFTSIGGSARNRIAKLNNTTGTADATWNPNANNTVRYISISNNSIYIGGYFTNVGGLNRNSVAKLNNTTGAADPSWNIVFNKYYLMGIYVLDSNVFIYGDVVLLENTVARNRLAKVNYKTGEIDPTWDPNANGDVKTVEVCGSDIYIGGEFTSVGGQTRNRIAKVNNTTGAVDPTWNPNSSYYVTVIKCIGSDVYVGGWFSTIGGLSRNNIAKLNNTTGAADPAWNPNADDEVDSMLFDGDDLYVGGWFETIGGLTRKGIAKLNLTTGVADPNWDAGLETSRYYVYIHDIEQSGSFIYAGGTFTDIQGYPIGAIAKINKETGLVDYNWKIDITYRDTVDSVSIIGPNIIFSGYFPSIWDTIEGDTIIRKANLETAVVDPHWDKGEFDFHIDWVYKVEIVDNHLFFNTDVVPTYFYHYYIDSTPPSLSITHTTSSPTNDTTPYISGVVTDSEELILSVEYSFGDGNWYDCTSDDGIFDEASENYTCIVSALTDGTHAVYVRVTDSNHNTTPSGSELLEMFTIDTQVTKVRITNLGLISNVPDSDSLFYYFTSQTPVISGTAEPYAIIYFEVNGHTYSTTANTYGNYSITLRDPSLDRGENVITYYQVDTSGNVSGGRVLTLMIGEEYFPDWLILKLYPDSCIYELEDTCISELLIEDVSVSVIGNTVNICWSSNIPSSSHIEYTKVDGVNIVEEEMIDMTDFCSEIDELLYLSDYTFKIISKYEEYEVEYSGTFTTGEESLEEACEINITGSIKDSVSATIDFTANNTESCTVKFGANDSELIYEGEVTKTDLSYKAFLNLATPSSTYIYYNINCTSLVNECSLNSKVELALPIDEDNSVFSNDFFDIDITSDPLGKVAVAGIVLALIPVSLSYPQFFIFAFAWIFPKRKKEPWGIVYDNITHEPIAFAVIRIYDKNGDLVKETVSDLDGKYSFLLNRGEYRLTVEHQDHGKNEININIKDEEGIITKNIGLQGGVSLGILSIIRNVFFQFFINSFLIIGLIGFVISLIALIFNFQILNLIIFLIYIFQLISFISIRKKKEYGYVYNAKTGERIKGAFVQVYDPIKKRQINVVMSDEKGRFRFNLDKGEYIIVVSYDGLNTLESELDQIKMGNGLIGFNINTELNDIKIGLS